MKTARSSSLKADPFAVLELAPDAGEDAIRMRYLELVKAHPPDRHPERFKEIQRAYDAVRDIPTLLSTRLFEPGPLQTREELEEILFPPSERRRIPLLEILRTCRNR